MKPASLISALVVAIALFGCTKNAVVTSTRASPMSLSASAPDAGPGTCWTKTVTPAVVETITHQVMLHPAEIGPDGRVQTPALYKTEEIRHIAHPRTEQWFEIPCAAQMTPDFIASVQRALQARGHYQGPITGKMDARTRTAISRYQQSEGWDSPVLTVEAARKLGLIAIERTPKPT